MKIVNKILKMKSNLFCSFFFKRESKFYIFKYRQEDIVSFGRTLVELTGGKGEKLPNSYSKEAKNFLNLCFR